jgi:hypothetical protein
MAPRTGLALMLVLMGRVLPTAAAPPGTAVSFRNQVAPILARKCLGCHNERKAEGGLDMSTPSRLRRGGEVAAETVVVAGDPAASYLIESVRGGAARRMPLKQPMLSEREIATLVNWVEQGARFDGPSEEIPLISLVDPLKGLTEIRPKTNRPGAIVAVAFDPSGQRLAAAHGRSITLFDAVSGKATGELGEHPGPVTALAFLPGGQALVACGGRSAMFGALTIWDLPGRSRKIEARGHSDSILAAALSPDGKLLATGGYDRKVLIWDVSKGTILRTLQEHTDAVTGVSFAPDGKRLASCSWDRTVRIWDWNAAKRVLTLSEATAELNAVAFTPDGTHLLAAGADRAIRSWRIAAGGGEPPRRVFAHGGAIVRLALSADGRTLASSGEDRRVKLWRLPGLEGISELEQPDLCQGMAFGSDGRLAVGRFDGSLDLHDTTSAKPVLAILKPLGQPAVEPKLARPATLNPPSPRGVQRGKQVRLTLTGNGVGRASSIIFREPGLSATIIPAAKPDADRAELDLRIAADARIGLHSFSVITPLGTPPFQTLAVTGTPEVGEGAAQAVEGKPGRPVELPAKLTGTIEKPGEVDRFWFSARAGQDLVFEVTARALSSMFEPSLGVLDSQGRPVIAQPFERPGKEAAFVFRIPHDGLFTLQVEDANYGGSGNHFYRINAGALPVVRAVYPLGVARGARTEVALQGWNLPGGGTATVAIGPEVPAGSLVAVPMPAAVAGSATVTGARLVVAADGPQMQEEPRSEGSEHPQEVAVPGGVSGRIERDGDQDQYAFRATRGEPLIIEVFGRRLGSPIDPVVEVLDAEGRPVPRAVLRPLDQTEIAFRDHGSTAPGIRLTRWNNLAINDHVLIGRELARIMALPRNPDDDCIFWNEGGQRLGMLETTPEQHPVSQPIYRVEILPAGTKVPPGGLSPVELTYRNDDGGPAFAKDARITFDPPRDGTFLARVGDVRGLGGDEFGYHLVIRRPRPDFLISLSTENPNIPRGGTVLVGASLTRIDGFDQAVELTADGLPPGVRCTPGVIEAGHREGLIALSADSTAPSFSPPCWSVTARPAGTGGAAMLHKRIDPGGPNGGFVTVIAAPDLSVTARPKRVVLTPGEETSVTFSVVRKTGWSGRVPIDVRNLPQGVRVLDIGLSGVLITEKETERSVRIFAEPWVAPQVRSFYAVGRLEAAGTEHSSDPLVLQVRPREPTR